MNELVTDIAGWIPAVILPTATFIQLVRLAVVRSAVGVSLSTWLLFGFANLGLYVYTEKYFEVQSILGLLVTAVLDFIIVAMIIAYRNKPVDHPAPSK
ncbi:hypothetical protein [Thiomicrorhabdus xiamenensis]|uniref:MtN3 and saliva related transmembrane protein n=1 Tax=Thiomicrorhabdus xiamenensis TaxID=2739063 RepID=A0A7D4TFB8_9GAMM|nr:hypothetical protein [Thiomicrorhabdus xiamenensis]QKI88728.1 hypothetical protein HQN79_03680 [Thiomicrorhabdus xiamenensis]